MYYKSLLLLHLWHQIQSEHIFPCPQFDLLFIQYCIYMFCKQVILFYTFTVNFSVTECHQEWFYSFPTGLQYIRLLMQQMQYARWCSEKVFVLCCFLFLQILTKTEILQMKILQWANCMDADLNCSLRVCLRSSVTWISHECALILIGVIFSSCEGSPLFNIISIFGN